MLVLLLSCILIQGCDKETDRRCTPEKKTYTWERGQTMDESFLVAEGDTMGFVNVQPGTNQLFTFEHSYEACEDIMDSGGKSWIRFMIHPGLEEFEYRDTAIGRTLINEVKSVWYMNSRANYFTRGLLRGKKLDGLRWKIDFDGSYRNLNGAETQVSIHEYFTLR
ncbi:MAG: hypothetical protein EOO09_21500 [Chitinophagaceae bacterium]|nr:MAG: hypothetical protein EOO09_21500 [Chitinophagaceae bacterium]